MKKPFNNPLQSSETPLTHVVIAKVTFECNINCKHCYCRSPSTERMSMSTLQSMIEGAGCLDADLIHFVWHGGEPLIAGLEFYRNAVSIQDEVAGQSGVRFSNAIQTNATLLTDDYASFFASNRFSVGVSLHVIGESATFYNMKAIEGCRLLKEHGVNPGVLFVIDPTSPPDPLEILCLAEKISCNSISLNCEFTSRYDSGTQYGEFIENLWEAQRYRSSSVNIREFVVAALTPKNLADAGMIDTCKPGWPCYKTVSAVDPWGWIYFGCDRFVEVASDSHAYAVGHVAEGGFKGALRSTRFAQLAAIADKEMKLCKTNCSLFDRCRGGCVADWMLNPKQKARRRPDVAICDGKAAAYSIADRSAANVEAGYE